MADPRDAEVSAQMTSLAAPYEARIREQSARIAALEAERDEQREVNDKSARAILSQGDALEARDRLIADLVAWDAEYYVDDGNVEFKSIIARAAAMQRGGR